MFFFCCFFFLMIEVEISTQIIKLSRGKMFVGLRPTGWFNIFSVSDASYQSVFSFSCTAFVLFKGGFQ